MDSARWERVQELFHQAADQPALERRSFLEAATGGDEQLVATVLGMLDEDSGGASLLDDDVAQLQAGGHACDVGGFIGIERKFLLVRRAFRHGAEPTPARAQIAENHKCRCAAVEAFVHVGAAGGFTNRMQVQPAEFALQRVDRSKVSRSLAEPFGKAGLCRRARRELDQVERQLNIFA